MKQQLSKIELLRNYKNFISEHLSESSIKGYTKDVRRFVEEFEGDVLTATQDEIEEFLSELASQENEHGDPLFKPNSLNRQRASIVSFYNYLVSLSLVAVNPATHIKTISYKSCRKDGIDNYLTSVEFSEFISSIRSNTECSKFVRARDILLCKLTVSTGIKINEASRLKINQVNMEENELTVIDINGNERVLNLPSSIKEDYYDYLKERERIAGTNEVDDFLLLSERLAPLSLQLSNHSLKKHQVFSKIEKKINNTTLRNTFVMRMLDGGMAVEELSKMLGHSTINFTSTIYREYIKRQRA